MCGICGICAPAINEANSREALTRMCAAISHRGPDGEGQMIDQGIALGHRRLSIIDLEGGDQPIFNEDGNIGVVFNGEIYNYRELRDELLKRGHRFSTNSDTEVIVHAYEEYGVSCLEHFNGMFAFALWDKPRRRLFIARDRLGEKPLYYRLDGERLEFASELKSLLANPECPREVDFEAVEGFLTYGYIPEPISIYRGINKLPAAHYLVFEGGRLNVSPYWTLEMPDQPASRDEGEMMEEFESLLFDAIRLRLRSDVPVGAFLSGGTDSNLIVSMAAELSGSELSTYSVGFSEADFDELRFARMTAERYGTSHHEIMLESLDEDLFPRIVRQFDEPFADSSAIPTYYVTREAARDLKVCLSGDAGDELFCGYERYNYEPFEEAAQQIPGFLRRPVFGTAARLLPDTFKGKGWLRRQSASGSQRWQRMMGPFDYFERTGLYRPEFHRRINDDAALFEPYFARDRLDEISRRMFADQKTYLPDDILVKVDRNSMWHGLEVRVPFLDHRLVEFANRLPLELKKRGGEQKWPIRKLLAPRVDEAILNKPKSGFGLPIRHWLAGSMKDFAREMLDSPDSRVHEWLDRSALSRLLSDHQTGGRDLSKRIWTLLWLEQWCREFG